MSKYKLEKIAKQILAEIMAETNSGEEFSFKLASLYGRFQARTKGTGEAGWQSNIYKPKK